MADALATPETAVAKRPVWFWICVAVSLFFALLTVALCVLWVRSYSHRDQFNVRFWPTGVIEIASTQGWLEFWLGNATIDWRKRLNTYTLSEWEIVRQIDQRGLSRGTTVGRPIHIAIPHWGAIAIAAGVAILPWCRRASVRFSLRTLLIATTLVAVLLGLFVWAAR